jgi:hypothetical protein
MPTPKYVSIHPRKDPEFPGLIRVLIRVREVDAIHWRTMKRPADMPWPDMVRDAERMAIERFPGLLTMQAALPIGNCGDVHG